MMRAALLLMLLLAGSAAAQEEVRISQYLRQLAEEQQFRLEGLEIVGSDTFVPPARYRDVEFAVGRALRRYNNVVSYAGQRPVRVTILGRKGNDVGALPESVAESVADTGADPATRD